MLRIVDGKEYGDFPAAFSYAQPRGALGALILRLTRHLRARHALQYLAPAERHLDIGCGDGYLLRRSPCHERIGIDRLLGDEVSDHLPFGDESFDFVTMLAVLEHLPNPAAIMHECDRILKHDGRLIVTTPRHIAEPLMLLYARHVSEQHEFYFSESTIRTLCPPSLVLIDYRSYLLGLNQVFCFQKMHPIANEGLARALSMSAN